MKGTISCALLIGLGIALSSCTTAQVTKIEAASANFQRSINSINADIAATSPLVARGCADLQKWAMLLKPFVPNKGKALQYFDAANGAISGYCQVVPTDIKSTATAVAQAVLKAQDGYYQVSK